MVNTLGERPLNAAWPTYVGVNMRSLRNRQRLSFGAIVAGLLLCAGCPSGDDVDPNEPHAMGVIGIGEAHASTGGTASSSVVASFVPDAAGMAPTCSTEVAGCYIPARPDCGGTCGEDEACGFDSNCGSVCNRICDADCGSGEECYFPTPDAPACRARLSFAAGAIALSGTTTPVTLFPPYAFDGVDEGSLFLDGAQLTATAVGANAVGYEAFNETFTATRLLRTQPALHELGLVDVFGSADVPVRWIAGEDEIKIAATVTSIYGTTQTITCEANDASGAFDLPRSAIDVALDGEPLDRMAIAVTRSRVDTTYGIATVGSIPGETIQPTGWLELRTSSTESTSFEGCEGDELLCSNECVDTANSNQHCGDCDNSCASGDYCSGGTCAGTTSCNACVNEASTTGSCMALYDSCTNTPACSTLRTCLNNCATQECVNQCFDDNPDGAGIYNNWVGCICNTACGTQCQDSCF